MPLIPGAIGISYVLQPEDVGYNIFCRVRGTNAAGFDIGQSNTVGPVLSSGPPPAISVAPEVTVSETGMVLTSDTGTWTNSPTSYAYQWYSDEAPDVAIGGATSATYVIDGGVIEEGSGAFAFLTSASGAGPSNVLLTTPAIDSTGADLLVIGIATYPGAYTFTITDSKSNTWNALTIADSAVAVLSRIYWCKPTTVGAGHTVTFDSTGVSFYGSATIAAFSGSAAAPFDQENVGAGPSATTGSAGSGITPSVANCLVIALTGNLTATVEDVLTPTIGTSGGTYTMLANVLSVAGTNTGNRMAYLIQTAATATDPEWAFGGSTPNGWTANIASFKPV